VTAVGEVVVVGGGLAGLAAAVRLAEGGAGVTLFEARPRLGGATHSFVRDGLTVDNGQHVFLRCYTAYQGFLRRLGVLDRTMVQPRFSVPVLGPGGRYTRLYRTGLPAPLHLGAALARYPLLRPAERLAVARVALRMRSMDPDDRSLDRLRFGPWLRRQGQSDNSLVALWEPFTVAALNLPVDEVSLALAVRVFCTGMLGVTDAPDIGFPLVPLQDLHGRPAAALLRRLGARVHLSAKVTAVQADSDGLRVAVDGQQVAADAVVLAVPHQAASRLLPAGALPDAAALDRLGAEPIVNVHVVYDRRVTALPFAATVGSPVQWVFDRGPVAGLPRGRGQYLALSLSAAREYVDTPTAALRDRFLPELARLFPAAGTAEVRSFFVTRERRATFRQAPGTRDLRPGVRTGVPGLFLAGAWTDTGWPDVMEGAVRSGEEAARLAVGHMAGNRERQEVTA
jgi:squalene-associated FAD-dependent desaturase